MKRLIFLFALLLGCGSNYSVNSEIDATVDVMTADGDIESDTDNCGNGTINPGESCDGQNFGAVTCSLLGFAEGELACTGACQLDTTGCYTCGNNTVEVTELCDGTDFGGLDCTDFGFVHGELVCSAACDVVDTSGCTNETAVCGDGAAEAAELCDGTDLRGQTCQSLGYAGGDLECNGSCDGFATGACWHVQPICGNGTVEPGEQCDDGDNDNADVCPDGINGTCRWATCGDGFVWFGHEECDDGNHSTTDDCPDGPIGSCEWYSCGDGYTHALHEVCDTVSYPWCHPGCQGYCGNGVIDPAYEECDDGDNVDDGDCTADCQGYCGDGIVDPGEQCDEGGGDGYAPDMFGATGAGPGCHYDCTTSVCGNGICECDAEETPQNCPGDCANAQSCCYFPLDFWGADPTALCLDGSASCCPDLGMFGPGGCCDDGGCVIAAGGPETKNCGSCGNHCTGNETCYNGTCQ